MPNKNFGLARGVLLYGCAFLLLATALPAQGDGLAFWKDLPAQDIRRDTVPGRPEQLRAYRGLALDLNGMTQALARAPVEGSPGSLRLAFPLPNGSARTFSVYRVPVMAPGLAARYPEIAAYAGQATDGSGHRVRFDLSGGGVRAVITTPQGRVRIEPFSPEQPRFYAAYREEDLEMPSESGDFTCGTNAEASADLGPGGGAAVDFRNEPNVELQVYRLAMAATTEFTAFNGGTRASALAVIASLVNQLNEILERDLAIRMELVEASDSLIFIDEDEYTNGVPSQMIEENPPVINRLIGVTNYDIGHVLGSSSSLAGIAWLGGVCNSTNKARGVTTTRAPRADPLTLWILAHEIGHQLGATHSFSSCQNVTDATAFEPGGGSTIMSYAGICSNPLNNLAQQADLYYHTASLEQIFFRTRLSSGRGCAEVFPLANRAPSVTIDAPDGLFVPISTPFRLRARGQDPDGDALTYTWEQFDRGPINAVPGSPEGDSPLFRSLPPADDPERVLPALAKILAGNSDRSEVLPTYSRALTFRCTVRDNAPGGGGVAWEQVAFRSDSTAGPFRILEADTPDTLLAGSQMELRWDVANTDNPRVNCQQVDILLSTDGGLTIADTLARSAPNSGSARITIPDQPTAEARILLAAVGNVFFDLSDTSFTILPPAEPSFALEVDRRSQRDHCLPDPIFFDLSARSFGGFDQELILDLEGELPPGASYRFSRPTLQPTRPEGSTLRIDLGRNVRDSFQVQVLAIGPGQDTFRRAIQFTTLSNDFSALRPLTPADRERNITFPGPFTWSGVPDAAFYRFELASDPGFGDAAILRAANLADTAYQPDLRLPDDAIFYWRVTPINACGPGAPTATQAFQSGLNACTVYPSEAGLVNIPGTSQQARPSVSSVITVAESGILTDVNVPLIQARYQPVRSLRMTLTSPSGTTVTLVEPSCGGTINFLTGFDDEAPDSLSCPPDDGLLVRPVDSLARFKGEDIQGDWTLTVTVDLPGFGSPGTLVGWSLEFCAPLQPTDPILSRLDTLEAVVGLEKVIAPELLSASRPGESPENLVYTLLSRPERGRLNLRGDSLTVGDRFTQAEVDDLQVSYRHLGSEEERDSFRFLLRDSRGGWLHDQVFPIVAKEEAVLVDTDEPEDPAATLDLAPNPARDRIVLTLEEPLAAGPLSLRLFTLPGRLARAWRFERPAPQFPLDLGGLPAGTYFLQIESAGLSLTRKVLLQP